jgi:hemerythrin superfamily protein
MSSVYEMLSRDHRAAAALLDRLKATRRDARKTREKLFAQLKGLLATHARFEEEIFYPLVRRRSALDEEFENAIADHDCISGLLDSLGEIDCGESDWIEIVEDLALVLAHHIEDEEQDLMPAARAELDDEEARDMMRLYTEMTRERQAA